RKSNMKKVEIIIKDTHRGLWYEDGVLAKVLEAGRYEIPRRKRLFARKRPLVEVVLVDMRERDLTIKGQEILTSDKVALRVSIVVQFRVVDPNSPCTPSRSTRTAFTATCNSPRVALWPR